VNSDRLKSGLHERRSFNLPWRTMKAPPYALYIFGFILTTRNASPFARCSRSREFTWTSRTSASSLNRADRARSPRATALSCLISAISLFPQSPIFSRKSARYKSRVPSRINTYHLACSPRTRASMPLQKIGIRPAFLARSWI